MMRALDLNVASRPFRNNTVLWLLHGAMGLLLAAFTVWNVRSFLGHSGTLRALRDGMAGIEARMADLDLREEKALGGIGRLDLKWLDVQTDRANAVILGRALSWTRLFNLLERLVPYEVRMSSVRPVLRIGNRSQDPREEGVEGSVPVGLEGTARSLEAFLELERSLLMDPHFDRVEPERSNVDENGELLFELRVLYFPEGRPEGPRAVSLPPVLEAVAEAEAEAEDEVGNEGEE